MTIVVGYVPDQYGRTALTYAVAEATLRAARLVVVNATKGDAYVDRRFAGELDVDAVRRELSTVGVEHEVRQSVGSDVAQEVLDVVAEVDAQLLVLGLRHRTRVGKLLMGSTAQRLLLDCPCPVLAVKPPVAEEPENRPGGDR